MKNDLQTLNWIDKVNRQATLQVPLQFNFQPIEIISKQLTKLKASSPYRIYYLGPRWNNSFLFHKMFSQKHGYEFDIFRINQNNALFSQTMSQNQFYRNQFYYRAFQGMNPTVQKTDVVFDSKFEGGNLDCAIKVEKNQFDLFLRIDSNTRGHIFWYNFTVTNAQTQSKIKFNICNFTKQKTLYDIGLKPFVHILHSDLTESDWSTQGVENVSFKKQKLRYEFVYEKIQVRELYELSFEYKFKQPTDIVQFSYCIPYGYTDLQKDLKLLNSVAEVQNLGKSLTGINIPIVKIGNIQSDKPKPVIFVTGRNHPSETNGSIKLSGFMRYLCYAPQAQFIRNNIITVIIPMLNPDGVILGNSRTGACGKDLNREFRSKNKSLYPEIDMVKQLITKIQKTHNIQLYLDFHGHSRKKNLFFFGPQYNVTQMQYYKARIIPKLLANITPIFRYYSCSFRISEQKISTARGVMLDQFGIPFVYTVESSIGVYHDFVNHKDVIFDRKAWESLGQSIGAAIKEYFENLFEYQEFLEAKRNSKNKNAKNIKIEEKKTIICSQRQQDIKIFKILTQIKKLDQKAPKKMNRQESDQSDSQAQQDNLQKQKMKQFQGMITDFNNIQERKITPAKEDAFVQTQSKRLFKRKLKNNNKNNEILNNLWKQSNNSFKGNRRYKSIQKSQSSIHNKSQNKLLTPTPSRLLYSKKQIQITNKTGQNFFKSSHFSQPKIEQKNENIIFFNFSRLSQKSRTNRHQKNDALNTLQSQVKQEPKITQSSNFVQDNYEMLNKINLFDGSPAIKLDGQQRLISLRKNRNACPVSFYRIKYRQISTKKNKKYEQYLQVDDKSKRLSIGKYYSHSSNANRSISLKISKADT